MIAQAPIWVSLRMVRLAARTLPSVHRLRYEGEFTAELYGMARSQQLRHATQVLTRAWALRAALGSTPPTIGEAMSQAPVPPLTCRLNLRHKWQIVSNEDGSGRYWKCVICGKANDGGGVGTNFPMGGV